jgi:hypothetical protein
MDRSTPYDLANQKHRRELDQLGIDALIGIFGEPEVVPEWDTPRLLHWQPGDPRPLFANDDPAVMQAIGRCAAARIWDSLPSDRQPRPLAIAITNAHPAECGWCSDELEELLAACDWATFEGRTQTAEWLTWKQERNGEQATYQRRVPVGVRSQRHADFWALSWRERSDRIRRAQYPTAVPR